MSKRFKTLASAAALGVALLATHAAQAVMISQMNGSHDVRYGEIGADPGTGGLGHSVDLYGDNGPGWAAALGSGAPVILVEQDGADGASTAAVKTWIMGGGQLIVLGGGSTESGMVLLNAIFGTSMTTEFSSIPQTFTKTAAAVGTTFADDPTNLIGLSTHHEVSIGALPVGSQVFWEGAGEAIVFRSILGDGDVFYIGYDFCCGGTQALRDDWYDVLDSAIEYHTAIPEPGTLALFGLGLAGLGVVRRRKSQKIG